MPRKFWTGARRPNEPVLAASRDIEIRIFRSDQPDGACRVSISGTDDRRADGLFKSPFSKAEIDQSLSWMDLATPWDSPAAADVRKFGKRLFESLFQGAVAGVYVASQDANAPARIRLNIDDPAAARIPWELLADPTTGEALSLRGRFVRGISTEGGARRLLVDPPLRVLVVDSAPRGLPRLESQLESDDISAALSGVVAQGRTEVVTVQHATLSGVVNALREATAADPPRPFHVLHWIGHGYVDPMTGVNQLLFEDDEGNADRVDGARLASVLVGSEIRLVLLNACHSAAPAAPGLATPPAAETTRGIAEVLLTAGIPAVVGMRVAVLDDTARRFAREFYAALADGRGVDEAVLDARIVVTGRASGVSAEVGVPVAYLRSGSGQLLSGVKPLAWWQVPLVRFRRLRPLVQGALFVVAVIATLAVQASVDAVARYVEGPARMTAAFNVVVTEFDAREESGQPVALTHARDLAQDFAATLESDLQGLGGSIEVRPPATTGRLAGRTANDRALAADELSRAINAHVVVYGSLDASHRELQPEIFVSGGQLTDAEELAGPMRLGAPIRARGPIEVSAAREQMQTALVSRARALAELIAGLSDLQIADYTAAEDHFDNAISRWGDAGGKEVLYLFRGSTAGVSDNLVEAEHWFREALALNDSYVRARLGLAEVAFQRARGSCRPDDPAVDEAGLRAARAQYAEAVTTADDPGAVSVSARSRLGMARVYICMSQAGIENQWDEAAQETSHVIEAYEAGDKLLKGLAAEAHAVRAITKLPVDGAADPCAHYEQAEEEFRSALELSIYADRSAAYSAGRAWVLARLGQIDEAQRAYERAIFDEPDQDDRAQYQRELDKLNPSSTTATGIDPSVTDNATSRTTCAIGEVP